MERLSTGTVVFNKVEAGALVVIGDECKPALERSFLIVPDCAGECVSVGGKQVLCVTPDAPVIKSFIGLEQGDYSDDFVGDSTLEGAYVKSVR